MYKGYSSFNFDKNKGVSLTDIELVKTDLLNHIFTPKGSRVNMSDFGTDLELMLFEQLTPDLVDQTSDEIQQVFNYDPRVQVIDFNVLPDYDNQTLYIAARLLYIELEMEDKFELNIQFSA